ncbi:acetyl-CoA acetyltransferase [Alkalihalobacillus alcalophilus ATCC 27647 = CGMCC 1.3604]|uniref:acetyl-CoA C-acyltransferase n=1 Tax=Alkalihalobacillus alcalophilus ATCC 27647 = CGMCC 1.3604 TaxID=1218173 RepID=A0A094WKE6_ALKAL|nr:acetyl-CoA C-acetyltransferase [Alkalihalobacillus alcalophilus]KGA96423.1 acetyl-CoA acetyltransferase [Alkalihalobacillus alcalophilus ATCC 27647 = CGMCC 1.3604]MED1563249.1 acetyl-CoA C-acetyltransferase [Alkalihalobacillus alcalophilus]THG89754.1 acetyl-CoA acetyltransferase [Alkalihalobacillus alcalophilus ATCC 27647 = CGMCC 1.3604]
MREAVIVSGARTAVGKAKKGTLANMRADDYAAETVKATLDRANFQDLDQIDDVIIGCAMPEAEQGMNMARTISLLAGLPDEVPGITINRYCSSGLQSISYAAERILTGQAKTIIAGGAESMSQIPMGGHVIAPNSKIVEARAEYYMNMGLTAEEVANRYSVSRADQDQFAVESQLKAAKALQTGAFKEEIVPIEVKLRSVKDNRFVEKTVQFAQDEGVRADTSIEGLGKLRPAFHVQGSVTAGNSSQMSDGAASVLVMDKEEALSRNLQPIAKFRSYAVTGCAPEIMGLGPIGAIPKALSMAGLKKEDIGLFEINEAFAAQALQVVRSLELDIEKVNVNGGAIALGHPLGCTGTKLTLTLLHEMRRKNIQYGVVSMCIGGGMGAAAVFELC